MKYLIIIAAILLLGSCVPYKEYFTYKRIIKSNPIVSVILILHLLNINLTAQKTPNTVIDFNNFDYEFAESLLHEKFNSELVKISENHKPLRKDSVAFKAMEY
jgi:hypothetical protein